MILIPRGGSSVYTSETFVLLVSEPQHLTKQPLDQCSTLMLYGRSGEMLSDRPQGKFFTISTVLLGLEKCSVSLFAHQSVRGPLIPIHPSVVLGSPGSGCTTLLKILANQRDTYHGIQGDVHYDSLTSKEIADHYRGDIQYSPEDDVHFPTLTVEETIRFAAKTRIPHTRADGQKRGELVDEITDILMTAFGLHRVQKTLVGDASIRGVSGGEKKRVSISETLACRSVVNCWDKCADSSW